MKSLVVEDDFLCRKALVAMMSKYGESDVALNGREAINIYKASLEEGQPYDLICLDVIMPLMNGRDALREIREFEAYNHLTPVKVLITTSMNFSKEVVGDLLCHCEGYLSKPIAMNQLHGSLKLLGLITF